jgi:Cytochrome c biogenesis factor
MISVPGLVRECLYGLSRSKEGLAVFEITCTMNPQYAPAWVGKGNCLSGLGRIQEADIAYEAALQLDPRNSQALAAKSRNLVTLGDPETALTSLELAISADPTNIALQGRMAEIYEKLGRYQDALDVWDSEVLNSSDPDQVRKGKATTLVRAGRESEALALYHDILVKRPDSGMLYEQYGDILALTGNREGAEDAYRKAMDIQPNLTGILLKIQALESIQKETPLSIIPIAGALCLSIAFFFRRKQH